MRIITYYASYVISDTALLTAMRFSQHKNDGERKERNVIVLDEKVAMDFETPGVGTKKREYIKKVQHLLHVL